LNYTSLFEEHIQVQRAAIRSSALWAVLLLLVGLFLIALTMAAKVNSAVITEAMKLGGGFVMSGLSFYQIKEVVQRRERIASYNYIKKNLEDNQLDPNEKQQLVQLAMKTLEETTKR
jgi:small-conductance mechanosensitive channel